MNTRIAPSPTGMFHIGTARTAYLNWLAARSTNGKFILRIDDTDTDRNNDDYVKVILDAMDWLGLDYDSIYYQSKRLDLYKNVANMLFAHKLAVKADNGAIILNADDGLVPKTWSDSIAGNLTVSDADRKLCLNTVLIKGDGTPTYNFCSVVDDVDFGINWIIRGVDHISNTPKQLTILNAINVAAMSSNIFSFSHVGLIHKDKKKISKRDGAASVLDYRDQGLDQDAFLNFLLRMGWQVPVANFDSTHPTVSKDLAVTLFLSGKLRSSPANFDQSKLDWYDRKYKAIKKK